MHIPNTFTPELSLLEAHLGCPIYVADERMEARLVNFGNCYQLWLLPVSRAGEEVTVTTFRFNFFDQARRHGATRRDFLNAFLVGHVSLTEIYRKAVALKWSTRGDGFEPVVFESQSLTIDREDRLGTDIFSPFVRRPPLIAMPATWSKEAIIRALTNGQVSDVRVLLGSDSNASEVISSTEGMDLAWAMTERWPDPWVITFESGRVQVCCPHGRWWSSFVPEIVA